MQSQSVSGDSIYCSAVVVSGDYTIVFNDTKYNITRIDTFEKYKEDLAIYAKKQS